MPDDRAEIAALAARLLEDAIPQLYPNVTDPDEIDFIAAFFMPEFVAMARQIRNAALEYING